MGSFEILVTDSTAMYPGALLCIQVTKQGIDEEIPTLRTFVRTMIWLWHHEDPGAAAMVSAEMVAAEVGVPGESSGPQEGCRAKEKGQEPGGSCLDRRLDWGVSTCKVL